MKLDFKWGKQTKSYDSKRQILNMIRIQEILNKKKFNIEHANK